MGSWSRYNRCTCLGFHTENNFCLVCYRLYIGCYSFFIRLFNSVLCVIYICTHIYIYIYIYIYTHIYMYIHIYFLFLVYMIVFLFLLSWLLWFRVRIHECTYVYVYIYIYIDNYRYSVYVCNYLATFIFHCAGILFAFAVCMCLFE